jgi:hypothetical protein
VISPPYLACELSGNITSKSRNILIKNLVYNNYGTQNTARVIGWFYNRGASGLFMYNYYNYYTPDSLKCHGSNYLVKPQVLAWLDLTNSKKINIKYSYQDTLTEEVKNDFFTGLKIN